MLLALLMAAAPSKHRLAAAAEAYLAGDLRAVEDFEALHEERPFDQEVALWLAIARIESQRCKEGAALLEALDSTPRVDAWSGFAARCQGDHAETIRQLESALEGLVLTDPLLPRVAAGLGSELVDADPERAAELLTRGGGDPRLHFPDAPAVLGLVGFPDLFVSYDGQRWRVREGLARPTNELAPDCGLVVSTEGVLRNGEVVVPALAGVSDIQARCTPSGAIWVLRRGGDGALLLGADGVVEWPDVNVVRFDVNDEVFVVSELVDGSSVLSIRSDRSVQVLRTPLELHDPEFID